VDSVCRRKKKDYFKMKLIVTQGSECQVIRQEQQMRGHRQVHGGVFVPLGSGAHAHHGHIT
jgi:hypothetical protein